MTHTPLSHLTDQEFLRHVDAVNDALLTSVLEREFARRMPALLERIGELDAEVVKLEDETSDHASAAKYVENEGGIDVLEELLIVLGDFDLHPIDIAATRAALEKARRYDELLELLADFITPTKEQTQ